MSNFVRSVPSDFEIFLMLMLWRLFCRQGIPYAGSTLVSGQHVHMTKLSVAWIWIGPEGTAQLLVEGARGIEKLATPCREGAGEYGGDTLRS